MIYRILRGRTLWFPASILAVTLAVVYLSGCEADSGDDAVAPVGGGPRVLTDGTRRVEVYPLPTSHAEDLVVVYLPAEKIVIEADHISPRNGQVRPAPAVKEFMAGLDRLNLDVATVVGIHGDSAPIQAARAGAS